MGVARTQRAALQIALEVIDAGLRVPEPVAPFAYFTTKKFLEVSGLASLRALPHIERLEDAGLLERPPSSDDLDGMLGLREEEAPFEDEVIE